MGTLQSSDISNLPSGWTRVKLTDYVSVKTGKKDANFGTEDGKYPFFTCAAKPLFAPDYSFEGASILVAGNGANVGLAIYYNGKFEAYQRTYVLQSTEVYLKYVYYHLHGFWKKFNIDKQYGTATNYIRMSNFETYYIPLPSLEEQEKIVLKIEELFSELDKGIEELEQAKARLKVYRQSVLKNAFEGCKNLVSLSTISSSRLGKMLDKNKNIGTYHKYLRNINVRWLSFDLDDLLEMRFEETELEKFTIAKNDLIICEGGEPGRCAVWKNDYSIYYQKALHRVRFNHGGNADFYMYYLWHIAQNGKLASYFTGTGIKHLTGESLKKVLVPEIFEEQKQIVEQIESKLSICDNIEQAIAESLKKAESLRQSILKKAFNGELV